MKEYVVYFIRNKDALEEDNFKLEYCVEASGEEEAKQKAIVDFHEVNPELDLGDFTYGFSKN